MHGVSELKALQLFSLLGEAMLSQELLTCFFFLSFYSTCTVLIAML